MEGIRAFNADLTSHLGNGIYQYEVGGVYEEKECKARKTGYHFVTYPPDCLQFYPWGEENRYFIIEAEDVNETGDGILSCKRMKMKQELNPMQFVIMTIKYMVLNPKLQWECEHKGFKAAKEKAGRDTEGVAIARGRNPRARGPEGSILGLVKEVDGEIVAAKAFRSSGNRWYTITDESEVVEE